MSLDIKYIREIFIERKLKPPHFTPSRTITSTVGYIREYKELPTYVNVELDFDFNTIIYLTEDHIFSTKSIKRGKYNV